MPSTRNAAPRIELLTVPDNSGILGEIFESAILHNMRYAAKGERNRHYVARAVVLVLKVKGEAEYRDEEGRVISLIPGSCILINPTLGHSYGPLPGSHWTEMYLSFRGPFFDNLERLANLMASPVRHLDPPGRWRERLQAVLPGNGESDAADACVGRLIAFLTDAFPMRTDPVGESDAWIPMAKRMLEHARSTVSEATERLAATTGLAPETLRKRFRKVVGRSMKSWQMDGKVATARSLLARGGMT